MSKVRVKSSKTRVGLEGQYTSDFRDRDGQQVERKRFLCNDKKCSWYRRPLVLSFYVYNFVLYPRRVVQTLYLTIVLIPKDKDGKLGFLLWRPVSISANLLSLHWAGAKARQVITGLVQCRGKPKKGEIIKSLDPWSPFLSKSININYKCPGGLVWKREDLSQPNWISTWPLLVRRALSISIRLSEKNQDAWYQTTYRPWLAMVRPHGNGSCQSSRYGIDIPKHSSRILIKTELVPAQVSCVQGARYIQLVVNHLRGA